MSKILNKHDIIEILYGAAFLSTGAGGTLRTGLNMLNDLEKESEIKLEMITVDEMQDDDYAALAIGYGSADAFLDTKFGDEAVFAFEGLQKIMKQEYKNVNCLYSLEYAGFNTFTPMYVAIKKGIPFIDTDANGKAIPSLKISLYTINGGITYPIVMSNAKGDITVGYPKDPMDFEASELMVKQMAAAYGMKLGIGTSVIDKAGIENKTILGAMTFAKKVGKNILESKEKNIDFIGNLKTEIEIKEICRGKVVELIKSPKDSFNLGTVVIENQTDSKIYFVDYKNENLLVRDSDNIIVTVPENICTFSMDKHEPITNSEIDKGMNLSISVVPAPKQWWSKKEGFDCYRDMLKEVGYQGEAVRY